MATVIAILLHGAVSLFMYYEMGFSAEACLYGFTAGIVTYALMQAVLQ